MKEFEKEFLYIILKIKLWSVKDIFQKEWKEDTSKIKNSPNILVCTGKNSNIYGMPEQKKLLHDSVTEAYKKASPKLEILVNLEAKIIAKLINQDDHMKCIARTPAFIMIKDHKRTFNKNHCVN